MRHEKINKFERSMKKILPILPSHDDKGFYFTYCSFYHHSGIVGSEKAQRCEEKKCEYLQKYRKRK